MICTLVYVSCLLMFVSCFVFCFNSLHSKNYLFTFSINSCFLSTFCVTCISLISRLGNHSPRSRSIERNRRATEGNKVHKRYQAHSSASPSSSLQVVQLSTRDRERRCLVFTSIFQLFPRKRKLQRELREPERL